MVGGWLCAARRRWPGLTARAARAHRCRRAESPDAAAATPLQEAAALLERSVRAVHLALQAGGDVAGDGASVWRVRVADLPVAWGLRVRAQYRDLISARALLRYVRTMRLSVHPLRKREDARVAVDSLRAGARSGGGSGLDAEVRTTVRALGAECARPVAPAPAPAPVLALAPGDPAAPRVFAPAVRHKRPRSEVDCAPLGRVADFTSERSGAQ